LRVIARGAICTDLVQRVPLRLRHVPRPGSLPNTGSALMLTRLHRWWMFYREARSLGFTRLDAVFSARARF
jgi:hypothetical protein